MKKIENYILVSRLRSGPPSEIYKAVHNETNEVFVIRTFAENQLTPDHTNHTIFEGVDIKDFFRQKLISCLKLGTEI